MVRSDWRPMALIGSIALGVAAIACSRESTEPDALAVSSASIVPAASTKDPQKPQVSPSLAADCKRICEPSRQLKCKLAADCEASCASMATATHCPAEFAAFYQCLMSHPVEHWRCDAESGIAAISEGYCDAEQELAVRCLERVQP